MKKIKLILKNTTLVLLFFLLVLLACEPISVSVNSAGEIAFARSEGIFFIHPKTKKLESVQWNHGKDTVPAIVRWSPDGQYLAYTVKDKKSSSRTSVYVTDRSGSQNKKVYFESKVITQLEWSPDGTFLSLAQQGQDSKMAVADIVVISLTNNNAKIIIQNANDNHKWYDQNQLVFIKLTKRNQNKRNNKIYKGYLGFYNVKNDNIKKILPVISTKSQSIDVNPSRDYIAFTALRINKGAAEFSKAIKVTNPNAYLYKVNLHKIQKLSQKIISYVKFSASADKILLKVKNKNKHSLAFLNLKTRRLRYLEKNLLDKVSANSVSVEVYPSWLDQENVLFWRQINTYGANGQSLQLLSVNTNTLKKTNLQVLIDSEIHKLLEQRGGY